MPDYKTVCDSNEWIISMQNVFEYPEPIKIAPYKNFPSYWPNLPKKEVIRSKVLKAYTLLTVCREAITYGLTSTICRVTTEHGTKILPDFTKRMSNLVLFKSTAGDLDKIDIEKFKMVVKKLTCIPMSRIFGRKGYSVRIKRQDILTPIKLGKYGESQVWDVKNVMVMSFPTLFLVSPATISLFLSLVRKSLKLSRLLEQDEKITDLTKREVKPLTKEIFESLEKISSFKTLKGLLVNLSCDPKDPFYARSPKSGACLSDIFPLDFFEFLIDETNGTLTHSGSWIKNYNGYQDMARRIYRSSYKPRLNKSFLDYLKKLYPESAEKIERLHAAEYRYR